jgi:hypothetical protein
MKMVMEQTEEEVVCIVGYLDLAEHDANANRTTLLFHILDCKTKAILKQASDNGNGEVTYR